MTVNGCHLSFSFLGVRMVQKVRANDSRGDWRHCHGEFFGPYMDGVRPAKVYTLELIIWHVLESCS
jgi:hypothetical protein